MTTEHVSAPSLTYENTRSAIRNGMLRALDLLVVKQVRDANKPRFRLLVDHSGTPMFHTVRDGLGDIMRIYRVHPLPNRYRSFYGGNELRTIRAGKGVGRPAARYVIVGKSMIEARGMDAIVRPYEYALADHGSQRAAAKALGLNLSTFQRRLKKEQAGS